jgi:hypothetical protein
MTKRKSLEVPPPHIPKKTRSAFHGNRIEYGANPSPAPAAMTTSTRATVRAKGEAIVTDTPAPVAKGKEIATSCKSNIHVLADTSLTFEAILTLANNMLTYASRLEKVIQDFNKAILIYGSGQEELARELKMGMAEVLRLYLPEK